MASVDEAMAITCDALRRHVPEARAIRPEDHIQNDLGLDSLAVMELIADIEDQLHVTIPNEALTEIATVSDVAEALARLSDAPA